MDSTIRVIAEQCSEPRPRVDELALCQLRPYVESFLNLGWLNAQLSDYEQWAAGNSDPFLQRSLLHRPMGFNMLAAAIWAARSWEEIYRKDKNYRPPGGSKHLLNIACSLAVLELNAGKQLDSATREHIRQRLQATGELWSIVHECNTFAYFIQKGVEVEPWFLKKASQQEIIVRWNGEEIPVQCKCKRPGAGRAISQEAFTTLAGCIAKDLKMSGQKLIVRIGSTGTVRPQDIDFLRDQVRSGVGAGSAPVPVRNDQQTFSIKTESLKGNFTIDSAGNYLASCGFHLVMGIAAPEGNSGRYEAVVVVGIDAKPDENPWRSLKDSVRDGARQLEGGPPGIVAIHYVDPISDFEQLRPGREPMRVTMGKMLRTLPHVGAVMLSSEPDLQLPGAGGPGHCRFYHGNEWHFPTDFPLGEPV